jgi:hypothetical protein
MQMTENGNDRNEEMPVVLYTSPDGKVTVNALVKDETLWMTQLGMAELFSVQRAAISKHLKNIFTEGELQEEVVVSKMETTTLHGAIDGKTQSHLVKYYNLDAIIAVGYRVNSRRATGKTAAEIVFENADHTKANMGLTTWDNAPNGRILKSDVTIAKNYLSIPKIRQLERAVSGFSDYIEGLVERGQTFTMEAFAKSVNAFLEFNQYKVLEGYGRVSRQAADNKAGIEYDQFNITQKIISDFDREVKRLLDGDKPDNNRSGK